MDPLTIRSANADSLDSLLPLFRSYQQHYSVLTNAGEDKTRAFLQWLLESPEQGFVILAEDQGEVIGFASGYYTLTALLAERLVHLGDLYVAPQHRRKGVATRLVQAVCEQAHLREIRLVRWLSVSSNSELNGWYASLGRLCGEFHLYLRNTDQTP